MNAFSKALYDLQGAYWRLAASGYISPKRYLPDLPTGDQLAAREGHLQLEIVSHCWNYSNLLAFQLASIAEFPPERATLTVTVFYGVEDTGTAELLEVFGEKEIPNVVWNWWALPKEQLFRRAIGRNAAALESEADWVWFTDCDLLTRDNCLDSLADALQGRRDVLVYPRVEHCTDLLPPDHPMLTPDLESTDALPIDESLFIPRERSRATGPLQIVHGDVARAAGYCNSIPYYQKPVDRWAKAHEDRALRWLLRSQGEPVDVPGVYRIRHSAKGRYTGPTMVNAIRGQTRKIQDKVREP